MNSMTLPKSNVIVTLLIIPALVLAGVAQFMPMGSVDSSGNIGIINYRLDATFGFHKADYSVHINTSGGGGILGGIGGGVSRDVNDSLYYATGMDSFNGDVGMVVDSFPSKDYTLNFSRREAGVTHFVVVTITYSVKTNPWWVIGREEDFTLKVEITKFSDPLFSHATVEKMEVEVWKDYVERSGANEAVYDYTTAPDKPEWSRTLSRELRTVGDDVEYTTGITLDENYGKVGIVGKADVTVYYTDGSESEALEPFSSTSHPNTINIYTIEQAEAGRIVGAVVAGPLTIIGMAVAGIGMLMAHKGRRRGFMWACGSAGIIEILGSILFYSGFTALIGLISFVKDDLTFHPGLALPAVAGALLLTASFYSYFAGRKEVAAEAGKISFTVKDSKAKVARGSGVKRKRKVVVKKK